MYLQETISTLADSSTTKGTVNLNKFGFQPEAIVGEHWKISTQIHMWVVDDLTGIRHLAVHPHQLYFDLV